jgi:hypothetical protein
MEVLVSRGSGLSAHQATGVACLSWQIARLAGQETSD